MIQSWITGTYSGLGHALALEALQHPNIHLTGLGRRHRIQHVQYVAQPLDLADARQVADFQFDIKSKAQQLICIHNAAQLGRVDFVDHQEAEDYPHIFQVNTLSPMELSRRFLIQTAGLEVRKVLVFISSGAAQTPYSGWSGYCATKAALEMFARILYEEQLLKPHPCEVYAIAPGIVDTDMQQKIRATDSLQFPMREKFMQLYEQGQLANPSLVAREIWLQLLEHRVAGVVSRIRL